ncbi:MAG: hypothetical protein KJO98_03900, partial [Rhodothermia bacterium]|nr:hypothetical protein [Rhodothermia bacterium]
MGEMPTGVQHGVAVCIQCTVADLFRCRRKARHQDQKEFKEMKKTVIEAINSQIQAEFESAYTYLG